MNLSFFQKLKEHRIIFILSFLYVLFLFYVNSNSPEIFWSDDLYHLEESFLLSEGDIRYAVDSWTRPLFAIPCAGMIKLLGYNMTSCRLINIFSMYGIILLSYFLIFHFSNSKILSLFGVASLATIPINIQTTISTLSQIEFGFILLLGIYMAIKKRIYLSSFLIGILPLIRSEGIILSVLWIVHYLSTVRDKQQILFIISLLIIPSIIWSISSYLINGIFLPQVMYPLFSPYPPVPFWLYTKNIIIKLGIVTSLISILSIRYIRKYDKNLKFLSIVLITITSFHLFLAHFSLGGSIGVVEYLVPFFPLAIILETKFLHFLSKKELKIISLPLLLSIILFAQFALFYISDAYKTAIARPYKDSLMYFDLSRFFYYNILPRNESVQFCGAQVIKNFDSSDLETPIQIRFQHNPDNEMPEICPKCFYSVEFTESDWVIWNNGWCTKIGQTEFEKVKPEDLINEKYQLVYESIDGSKKVFRKILD